jgi:hypothetical protein
MSSVSIKKLEQRLAEIAIDQLRDEVVRLDAENEQLRRELSRAQEAADGWRSDALELHMQLAAALEGRPAITREGQLVVAPAEGAAP